MRRLGPPLEQAIQRFGCLPRSLQKSSPLTGTSTLCVRSSDFRVVPTTRRSDRPETPPPRAALRSHTSVSRSAGPNCSREASTSRDRPSSPRKVPSASVASRKSVGQKKQTLPHVPDNRGVFVPPLDQSHRKPANGDIFCVPSAAWRRVGWPAWAKIALPTSGSKYPRSSMK